MWLKTAIFAGLLSDLSAARTYAQVIADQNKALQVNLNWMSTRITQLEKERAAILTHYMGVTVPTPSYELVPNKIPEFMGETAPVFNHLEDLFNDVGDKTAREMGLDWDSTGRVVSTGQHG